MAKSLRQCPFLRSELALAFVWEVKLGICLNYASLISMQFQNPSSGRRCIYGCEVYADLRLRTYNFASVALAWVTPATALRPPDAGLNSIGLASTRPNRSIESPYAVLVDAPGWFCSLLREGYSECKVQRQKSNVQSPKFAMRSASSVFPQVPTQWRWLNRSKSQTLGRS